MAPETRKTKAELLRAMSDAELNSAMRMHSPGGVIMEFPAHIGVSSLCDSDDPNYVDKNELAAELARRTANAPADGLLSRLSAEELGKVVDNTSGPAVLCDGPDGPFVKVFPGGRVLRGEDAAAEIARRAEKAPEVKVGQRWKNNATGDIVPVVKIQNHAVLSGFFQWDIPRFVATHTLIPDAPPKTEPVASAWAKTTFTVKLPPAIEGDSFRMEHCGDTLKVVSGVKSGKPREPKAREVWRDTKDGELFLAALHESNELRLYSLVNGGRWSDNSVLGRAEVGRFVLYAESFDAAVEKRAREMGMDYDKNGHLRWHETMWNRVWEGARQLGMESQSQSSDGVLAFIRELVVARDAKDTATDSIWRALGVISNTDRDGRFGTLEENARNVYLSQQKMLGELREVDSKLNVEALWNINGRSAKIEHAISSARIHETQRDLARSERNALGGYLDEIRMLLEDAGHKASAVPAQAPRCIEHLISEADSLRRRLGEINSRLQVLVREHDCAAVFGATEADRALAAADRVDFLVKELRRRLAERESQLQKINELAHVE